MMARYRTMRHDEGLGEGARSELKGGAVLREGLPLAGSGHSL